MFKTRGVQFPIRTSETGLPIGLIHIERTCPFSTPAGKESASSTFVREVSEKDKTVVIGMNFYEKSYPLH